MPEFDSTVEYLGLVRFPGYCVGSDGSVWSCRSKKAVIGQRGTVPIITDTWHRMALIKWSQAGHLSVYICPSSKRMLVSRLVLEAFVGPPSDDKNFACHNDGNPKNNQPENLRWDNQKGNLADRKRHGTLRNGERSPFTKLSDSQIADIRQKLLAPSRGLQAKIAREYGVSQTHIMRIRKNQVRQPS